MNSPIRFAHFLTNWRSGTKFIPNVSAFERPARWYTNKSNPQQQQQDEELHGGIQLVKRWWRRLRPLNLELEELRRRFKRSKSGFDFKSPNLTRYFVRFPFLTASEFAGWQVTTDSMLGEGHSWAEFVRSPRSGPGCATTKFEAFDTTEHKSTQYELEDDSHPFAHNYAEIIPSRGPSPGGRLARSDALVSSATDPKFAGYGLFRGFLSTRVPERGDLVRSGFVNLRSPESTVLGFVIPYAFFDHTHLIIRYRGDGRSYRINLLPRQQWDVTWYNLHHFVLYTNGGPYWQTAKIPFSKFFLLSRGAVHTSQQRVDKNNIRMISFSLMDRIEGPFALELDYIALYSDPDHLEQFAYEQYDRSGILQ